MKEHIITASELATLMNTSDDYQLVDVRIAEKHHAFNIGGTWIPMEELPTRLNELSRNKLIVTYCTSGNRSMHALLYLLNQGFTKIKSLDGGMTAWKEWQATG